MLNPGDECAVCGKTGAEIEREYLERKSAGREVDDRPEAAGEDEGP